MTWLPMTNCKSRLTHQSVYVLDWFHKRLPSSFHFWMNFYMSACFANDHQSMASHGVSSLRLHDFSSLMSSNCVDASRTDEPGSLAINR
jgi:hypothetical protein